MKIINNLSLQSAVVVFFVAIIVIILALTFIL